MVAPAGKEGLRKPADPIFIESLKYPKLPLSGGLVECLERTIREGKSVLHLTRDLETVDDIRDALEKRLPDVSDAGLRYFGHGDPKSLRKEEVSRLKPDLIIVDLGDFEKGSDFLDPLSTTISLVKALNPGGALFCKGGITELRRLTRIGKQLNNLGAEVSYDSFSGDNDIVKAGNTRIKFAVKLNGRRLW